MGHSINNTLIEQLILESISTDKFAHPSFSPVADNSNKDLVDTLIYNPELPIENNESYEKTAAYLDTRLTHKVSKYPPELSLWLQDFASALHDEDIHESYVLADNIFGKYAHLLSFKDAVHVLLVFAEHDIEKNLFTAAFVILRGLHESYLLFSQTQKHSFDFLYSQCLFRIGLNKIYTSDYLYQAITHARRTIQHPYTTKEQLNISLYIIIKTFELLKIYPECLLAIEEYFRTFPLDTNNPISSQVLFSQGIAYHATGECHLALQSFFEYLRFHPSDTVAKKWIRHLSEQEE